MISKYLKDIKKSVLDHPICLYFKHRYIGRILTSVFYSKLDLQLKAENHLYRQVIKKYCSSFKLGYDLGAYHGQITHLLLNLRFNTIIAVEPEPGNLKELSIRFCNKSNVTILESLVSDRSGPILFYSHAQGGAASTVSDKWKQNIESKNRKPETIYQSGIEVNAVTLQSLIKTHGTPSFLKIDVEGHEWSVLSTLNRSVDVIVFEANLPLFSQDTVKCIHHIVSLDPAYQFNVTIDEKSLYFESFIGSSSLIDYLLNEKPSFLNIIAVINKASM